MQGLTRRTVMAGFGAGLCGAALQPANAVVQDRFTTLMRRVMGMTWMGKNVTRSAAFNDGEFVSGIGMIFSLGADWRYTGTLIEGFTYNGTAYRGTYAIAGECWTIGDDAGVSIYESRLVEATPLPPNLGWSRYRGDFRFYNDSTRPGQFTMQGLLTDTGTGGQSRAYLNGKD